MSARQGKCAGMRKGLGGGRLMGGGGMEGKLLKGSYLSGLRALEKRFGEKSGP